MPRPLAKSTELSEQHALNAIAFGVAAARSTDLFVNDAKGTTLSLSVTNASKAVPVGTRAIAMWCASDFYYRINTAADTSTGALGKANDVIIMSIDPDDPAVLVSTVQAILASSTATLYMNFYFGS